MKTILMFLVLLSTLSFGQTLPLVVDNSQWFPPVRSQEAIRNCTMFSFVYYLKSSIWNKQFGRDPKLEANQFNHNFVWSYVINPETAGGSYFGKAVYLMKDSGCATVSEFPINEQDENYLPSTEVKQKALPFKSKRMTGDNFRDHGSDVDLIGQRINALKDSLSKGKCFTLGLTIFHYFEKMTTKNNVYSCYKGISVDSMYYAHAVTIVGYNDTIKTAQGRGAFQAINSYAEPAGGHFYFDYNWFYFYTSDSYDYYFLEEDFSSYSEVINTTPVFTRVPNGDLNVIQGSSVSFDFDASDPENTPIVYSVVSGLGGTINSTTGQFTYPSDQVGDFPFTVKATDGFYSITTTFNVKVTEIIVIKPLEFTKTLPGETIVDQATLFSFRFEASGPNQPLTFSGADNYSPDHFTVSLNQTTGDFTFISHATVFGKFIFKITVSDGVSSVSTLAIIIVKSSYVNTAPTFVTTPGTLATYTNKVLDYQFEANDFEGDSLTFSILDSLPEASLTSNGKLTFMSANAGTYTFTVVVSDGQASTSLVVSVKVDFNVAVETIIEPDYSISIYPNPVSDNTNIKISMKKRSKINLSIYDLQGRQIDLVANTEYEAGENTISYDASNLKSGAYICRLVAANFSKSIKIVKQ